MCLNDLHSLFLDYMDWYKEGTEFDRTNIQVRKIDKYTYSIKYYTWGSIRVDPFCMDGSMCMPCYGKGYISHFTYLPSSSLPVENKYDCTKCNGTGKETCAFKKKRRINLATMKFENKDKYSIIFN